MASIKDAIRLCKRIMLTNLLTNDYSIAVTPLLSGKHGIGKSQVAKSIAKDLGGTVMVIEGGTLKEGEITGIPYQCKNESGEIVFRFLPYYIVQRIQKAEQFLHREDTVSDSLDSILNGEENRFSDRELSFDQKVEQIRSGKVKPVILFFDEINRTDTAVFRELMNIILTRTVNGYRFPWWVFIIAAMNPSTQSSMYATNEMDPAQLDRFIKIKVREDANEWAEFAIETIIECDAEIQQVYKVRSSKDISYNIHGHGGTSFIPVIEFVNSFRYFRDAILIYFTDGYGDPSIPRPLTRENHVGLAQRSVCALCP